MKFTVSKITNTVFVLNLGSFDDYFLYKAIINYF